MKWTRGRGSYSNKSDSEIDDWRGKFIHDLDSDGLVGTLVMGGGRVWVEIQGDDSDVDDAMHDLEGDSFLDDFQVTNSDSISSQQISDVYTYHEDRTPRTTDDI